MSELSPALISIAGGNEFLFARFYHIYEGVQLVLPESPPIVSGVSDMPRRIVQTWKRHGIRCKPSEEMLTFFSNEFPVAFPHEILKCVSYNITYHPKEVYAYCDNSTRQTDYIPVCSPAALICANAASAATSTS